MNTLDDLRTTLDRHASGLPDPELGERAAAVRGAGARGPASPAGRGRRRRRGRRVAVVLVTCARLGWPAPTCRGPELAGARGAR